jgi:ribose transport system permease protein
VTLAFLRRVAPRMPPSENSATGDASAQVTVSSGSGISPEAPAEAKRRAPLTAFSGASTSIVVATALLFLVSWIFERQSVSHSSLLGMLPFASVLAITAIGQTLVIQQGGIDLSVPGMISITVVIMTRYPNGDSGKVLVALLLALAVTLAAGVVSGLAISRIGVTPIVATLGMNALLYGGVLQISGGTPRTTTSRLHNFASGKVAGIPNTVIIAVILTAVVAFVIKRTILGRRFEAVGAGVIGARAAGVETRGYQLSAYAGAAAHYCLAGVLLAGVVSTPSAFQGDQYLLPSVAAVVLGGTSLLGGRGSVVASAIAALFISQLDQFVLTIGAKDAVQNLVEAGALAAGLAVYSVPWRRLLAWSRNSRGGRGDGVPAGAGLGLGSQANQGAQLASRPNE